MIKKGTFFDEKYYDVKKLEKYYPEIFSDIPRVCAIAGCSYLDGLLNDLLDEIMVKAASEAFSCLCTLPSV